MIRYLNQVELGFGKWGCDIEAVGELSCSFVEVLRSCSNILVCSNFPSQHQDLQLRLSWHLGVFTLMESLHLDWFFFPCKFSTKIDLII